MWNNDLDSIDESKHAFISVVEIQEILTSILRPISKNIAKDKEYAENLKEIIDDVKMTQRD